MTKRRSETGGLTLYSDSRYKKRGTGLAIPVKITVICSLCQNCNSNEVGNFQIWLYRTTEIQILSCQHQQTKLPRRMIEVQTKRNVRKRLNPLEIFLLCTNRPHPETYLRASLVPNMLIQNFSVPVLHLNTSSTNLCILQSRSRM